MSGESGSIPVAIQIAVPSQELTIEMAKEILNGTGLSVDEGYGPYCVEPEKGTWAVRGTATPEVLAKVNIAGVVIFSLPRVSLL